jgi:hypothetical protein
MIFLLIDSLIIEQSTLGRASVARMGYLFNLPIDPMFDDARDTFHPVAIARNLKRFRAPPRRRCDACAWRQPAASGRSCAWAGRLWAREHDPSRLHKERAKITVPALGDAAKDGSIAGRDLSRHETKPGAEVAPHDGRLTRHYGRHHGACDDWADAGYRSSDVGKPRHREPLSRSRRSHHRCAGRCSACRPSWSTFQPRISRLIIIG